MERKRGRDKSRLGRKKKREGGWVGATNSVKSK
jgi:hypothetical protein